jgi:signal transduction histidine kinase
VKTHIFIIEDETQIARVLKVELEYEGYQVTVEHDGKAGLETALHSEIEVFLKRNQQHALILIKDYGIGIPEKEIVNIFERFYRVDKARSRETGGHGLGLHIAKSIIKLHKGDIKINSKEGLGTKVELFLPISNENIEN